MVAILKINKTLYLNNSLKISEPNLEDMQKVMYIS